MSKELQVVIANTTNGGIGFENDLPWKRKLSTDLKRFRQITTNSEPNKMNAVIMGRKTWESLPLNYRPLPNRINIILSKNNIQIDENENVCVCTSFENALEFANNSKQIDQVFVIGGSSLFDLALQSPFCSTIHQTLILENFNCDTKINMDLLNNFTIVQSTNIQTENNIRFQFQTWNVKTTN